MAKVFKFAEFTNNVLEKLSIQPVTKERMVKKGIVHYNSSDEMKDNFQTGDVVTFGAAMKEGSGEYTELQTLMYIAPSDYDYLDWHTGMNFDRKDTQKMGVFVVFLIDENGKTSFDWNNYTFLQDYNSKLDWSGGYVGNILRVYRMLDFKCNRSGDDDGTLLFDEDTFEFQKKRAVVVWSRKVNFVSEKLTIQPVTKERLAKTDVSRKIYRVGDIVYCTYLGRVYFYEITKRTKSWLWLVRIGEKLTKGSKNFSTYSVQPDSDVVYEDETKRAKIGSDGYASVKIFYQETLYVWKGENVEGYCDN